MILLLWSSRKCKLNYKDNKQVTVAWGQGKRRDDCKAAQDNFWGLNKMFVILIVVTLSCVFTYVQNHQLYSLTICNLLFVNYTLIKL